MNLLPMFILFNVLNVVIQTIKSICTIKCNKWIASIVNAIAYGLYTYIVVLTVCELPLWTKIITVALANLVGVFLVKTFEERAQKDKLWKIEVTVPDYLAQQMIEKCNECDLKYNYIIVDKYHIFNFYCPTKQDSYTVKEIIAPYGVKYFISQNGGVL